jgi:hypothetical protein
MDTAALALTAFTLVKPFLEKTGEGIAKKIGEDIWSVIKRTFTNKGENNPENLALTNQDDFKLSLEAELKSDSKFMTELTEIVEKAQIQLSGNFQQNNNIYGKVEKQINIQQNTGNITM